MGHWHAGPVCQRHRDRGPPFAGKCLPTVSFSGGSKGTNVLLGRFRVD